MDDLIQEFLAETTESLNALDQDIVRLEQCPDDKDLIGRIFRLVHTVKGTCGFLGLSRLEKVAHHSENVLGRYRDGTLSVQPESVSLILEAFDTIKSIVESLAAEGQEPSGSDQDLIARLDALYESAPSAAPAPAAPETLKEDEHGFVPVPACDFVPETLSVPPQEQVREKTSSSAPKTPQAAGEEGAKSLRVNVDVLENLMTMVSELVLTRNQLLQIMRQHPDSSLPRLCSG